MEIVLKKSKAKGKKFAATFTDKAGHTKTINFGAEGYQDYTQHHDPDRQKKYLARHKHDPTSIQTPGGLARDVLWSKPSLGEAIKFTEKKHGVKIILRRRN